MGIKQDKYARSLLCCAGCGKRPIKFGNGFAMHHKKNCMHDHPLNRVLYFEGDEITEWQKTMQKPNVNEEVFGQPGI